MNSEKRIIYKSSNGSIRVIVPADNIDMTVEEIAQKDVPTGVKYKIVDVSEISSDRTFRNAWDIDEAELTDGTGADYGVSED
jgi:ribosomal protein S12